MEQKKPFCPQCALKAVLAGMTKESIEAVAIETAMQKGYAVDEDEFERRMYICNQCASLLGQVMCRESGFYVAAKAIDINAGCPFPGNNKWQKNEGESK